jgi:hypothetical protein
LTIILTAFNFAVFGNSENMHDENDMAVFFTIFIFPYLLGYPVFIRIGYPVLALSMVDRRLAYEPYDMN